ncbi:MAG: tail fiber domain-containing protein [Saprospiraceae bacterium]|nr:tail fiber domain-containing protein [Saprospiraceae bacterium]
MNNPNVGSDRRIKENIKPISYGLRQIMRLTPVQYRIIGQNGDHDILGLIAQDVKQIIPDIVEVHQTALKSTQKDSRNADRTDMIADMHTMRYSELIPVLIKAMQEQQDIIQRLTQRIEDLEKKQ